MHITQVHTLGGERMESVAVEWNASCLPLLASTKFQHSIVCSSIYWLNRSALDEELSNAISVVGSDCTVNTTSSPLRYQVAAFMLRRALEPRLWPVDPQSSLISLMKLDMSMKVSMFLRHRPSHSNYKEKKAKDLDVNRRWSVVPDMQSMAWSLPSG